MFCEEAMPIVPPRTPTTFAAAKPKALIGRRRARQGAEEEP